MKQYLITILPLLLGSVFLFTKCGTKESAGDQEDPAVQMSHEEDHSQHADQSAAVEDAMPISEMDDRAFQTLITGYLDLNRTMVDSDLKGAQSIANRLLVSLTNFETTDALNAIKNQVKGLAEAGDIGQQRSYFKPLSEQLYQLAKVNQGQQVTLYKQYCPMAFDGKGAFWLSDNKEIKNPYFGAQMLNCGTVQDSLVVNN